MTRLRAAAIYIGMVILPWVAVIVLVVLIWKLA